MFCYRLQANGLWRELDLRNLAEIPRAVIEQATVDSIMWDVFDWGIIEVSQMSVLDNAPMRMIKDIYSEWQKDSQIDVEDIMQLMNLIEKHSAPLELDLIDRGLRLRDCPSDRFNWRDLYVIVSYADPYTNVVAATDPERYGWGKQEMLLARLIDSAEWLVWSKTKDAAEGGDPPERMKRPGVKPKKKRAGFDTKPLPLSRIRELAKIETDQAVRQHKMELAFRQ